MSQVNKVIESIKTAGVNQKVMTPKSRGILYFCLIMAELASFALIKPKSFSGACLVACGAALGGLVGARCITRLLGIDYYSKEVRR